MLNIPSSELLHKRTFSINRRPISLLSIVLEKKLLIILFLSDLFFKFSLWFKKIFYSCLLNFFLLTFIFFKLCILFFSISDPVFYFYFILFCPPFPFFFPFFFFFFSSAVRRLAVEMAECDHKIHRHRLHGPAAYLHSAAAVPRRTTAFLNLAIMCSCASLTSEVWLTIWCQNSFEP